MTDRVLIPLPTGEWIALSLSELAAARLAASAMGFDAKTAQRPSAAATEPLCDSSELATAFRIPKSWVDQAARDGRIPCVRVGRRVRFRRSEVEPALTKEQSKRGPLA